MPTSSKNQNFTCFDPDSRLNVGPTAFTRASAWHHAAERLTREPLKDVSQAEAEARGLDR